MLKQLPFVMIAMFLAACGPTATDSYLLDDEEETRAFEPNLDYLSEVLRKPMAKKMDEQSWPLTFDERNFFFRVKSDDGQTRVVNAQANFRPAFTRFAEVAADADIIKYEFGLKASAPLEGRMTLQLTLGGLNEDFPLEYAADIHVETQGWLAVLGFNEEESTDEDEFVDLSARLTGIEGRIDNFRIINSDFQNLPDLAKDAVNQAIQRNLNGWAENHQDELMRQSNEEIAEAEEEGEMTARGDDVFSVLQDGQ